MIQTITVTDAVRNFSELLNSIRYRGERYTILKRGKPSATIGPAEGSVKERNLSDLKEIMRNIPRLEDDGEAFARDIARAIAVQPPPSASTINGAYVSASRTAMPATLRSSITIEGE